MKKIAAIGTHGAGKTSFVHGLAYKLKTKGFSVDTISESMDECPYGINENMQPETAKWFIAKHLKDELDKEAKNLDYLIADRSIIDSFVYANPHSIDSDLNHLAQFCDNYLTKYDLIIFIRPEGNITSNGVRSECDTYQKIIDKQFAKILDNYDINLKEISTSEIEQTIEYIANHD